LRFGPSVYLTEMDRRTRRPTRRGLILLALACAALLAPGAAAAAPSAPQKQCVEAGTAPLPALGGRAFIENRAGFSNPRLSIRWRSRGMPAGCEAHFRRSVAVEVRLRTSKAHVAITLGQGHRELGWLTFIEGFGREPSGRAGAVGMVSSKPLGCIEKAFGLVRYEVADATGHVLRRRVAAFEPHFQPCR
jgi:hypothetical protein